MTTATAYPASPAQQKFIADLLAKRQVPELVAEGIKAVGMMSSRQASANIDLLKTFPVKPNATVSGTLTDLLAAFEAVPNGRYALPTVELRTAFPVLNLSGDLLFLEVKSWNGRRYLNRLTGGGDGGEFVRSRLPLPEQIGLLRYMAHRPVELIQAFGEHFVCCGRCGKTLTDPESRRLFVGPECRKALGL